MRPFFSLLSHFDFTPSEPTVPETEICSEEPYAGLSDDDSSKEMIRKAEKKEEHKYKEKCHKDRCQ